MQRPVCKHQALIKVSIRLQSQVRATWGVFPSNTKEEVPAHVPTALGNWTHASFCRKPVDGFQRLGEKPSAPQAPQIASGHSLKSPFILKIKHVLEKHLEFLRERGKNQSRSVAWKQRGGFDDHAGPRRREDYGIR